MSGVQILFVLHTIHEKVRKTSRCVGSVVGTPTLVSYLERTLTPHKSGLKLMAGSFISCIIIAVLC